ncbi:uncharacterized protein BDZ83DRAFT_296037 [Colletotrichum acutatum]|uniref:Uncharacterized protein n=1 Tax=Glomerella acutata TaxID=27357 RepID=A0AAD9D251_GLOAC|nr:uncharacterized protein BDZ83DRAFT_296037 [Colletotrichum acutatum]KAK1731077.1 hypothetical protein BDZ83DRAFT_296037 [Colletotrichum acutatum]
MQTPGPSSASVYAESNPRRTAIRLGLCQLSQTRPALFILSRLSICPSIHPGLAPVSWPCFCLESLTPCPYLPTTRAPKSRGGGVYSIESIVTAWPGLESFCFVPFPIFQTQIAEWTRSAELASRRSSSLFVFWHFFGFPTPLRSANLFAHVGPNPFFRTIAPWPETSTPNSLGLRTAFLTTAAPGQLNRTHPPSIQFSLFSSPLRIIGKLRVRAPDT